MPFAFLFLRTRTHDLFPFTGLPEIAAKRDFREEEERSAHAGAALQERREKAADRDDEGSSPVTSTTKKRRVFALRFFVFADANPRPLFIIFHCYIYVRRIPQALPPADFSLRNRDLHLIIPLQYAGKHDQLQRKPGLGAVIAFCSIHQLREYPSALLFGTVGA